MGRNRKDNPDWQRRRREGTRLLNLVRSRRSWTYRRIARELNVTPRTLERYRTTSTGTNRYAPPQRTLDVLLRLSRYIPARWITIRRNKNLVAVNPDFFGTRRDDAWVAAVRDYAETWMEWEREGEGVIARLSRIRFLFYNPGYAGGNLESTTWYRHYAHLMSVNEWLPRLEMLSSDPPGLMHSRFHSE